MKDVTGTKFEQEVEEICEYYKSSGRAMIVKFPKTKKMINGKLIYTKNTPFDFMGLAHPAVPIGMECKHKKASNAKTAKFKLVTHEEVERAKMHKKMGKKPEILIGIQPHQLDNLHKWQSMDGLGILFLKIEQTGKKTGFRIFYGIIFGKTLDKIWEQWMDRQRDFVLFPECDMILSSVDFLSCVIERHLGRG